MLRGVSKDMRIPATLLTEMVCKGSRSHPLLPWCTRTPVTRLLWYQYHFTRTARVYVFLVNRGLLHLSKKREKGACLRTDVFVLLVLRKVVHVSSFFVHLFNESLSSVRCAGIFSQIPSVNSVLSLDFSYSRRVTSAYAAVWVSRKKSFRASAAS